MATKINTAYYGAENTWTPLNIGGYTYNNFKYTPKTLQTYMFTDDTFDKVLDASACPWGIPECSVTSMRRVVYGKTDERLDIRESKNERKNTPLLLVYGNSGFYSSSFTDSNDTMRANAKRRVYGNITKVTSPNVLKSSNTCDSGNTVVVNSTLIGSNVYTSFDYQAAHIVPDSITGHVKTESSSEYDQTFTFSYLATADENVLKNLEITSFRYSFYVNSTNADVPSFVGNCLTSPDILAKETYFDDTVTEIFNYFRAMSNNTIGGRGFRDTSNISALYSYSNFGTKSSTFTTNAAFTPFTTASAKRQVFDDVSYHWETRFVVRVNGVNMYYRNDDPLPASGSASTYQALIIDSYDDSLTYGQAIQRVMLHELAFIGLPIYTDTTKLTIPPSTGDTTIYIPVFDLEHMMTTGQFKNGAAGSALPNAQWGDIFADTMPEYDPDYVPPEPEPEEKDSGDTKNLGRGLHFFPDSYHIYLLSGSEFYQAMVELNSYYSDKTPDDWSVDFQGVNPADYIIGAYVTQLALPPDSQGNPIKIGNIQLNTNAYEVNNIYTYWETFSYGTRHIDLLYGDFRDYEPYTKIELYLPLAGTVELDVSYCMGHDITVNYYYDIMTMSAVAAVYRDDMLYKTLDFAIGSQVPLLSSNMGSYQNQIEQLSVARQRNNIALATSATAAIAGATVGIATGSPMAILGSFGGFSKYANEVMTSKELDYQFDHIAPTVSQTGAAESQNSLCVGQLTPKLIIKRAVPLPHDDDIYSKTVGNACCITSTIGAMTGRIVCSNIDCDNIINDRGMSPTADEINAIKQAFASGVII